jgi:hypothetical protein
MAENWERGRPVALPHACSGTADGAIRLEA